MLYAVDFPRAPFNSISIVISSPLSECTPRSILLNLINAIIGGCKKVHTQEGAADVLGDLVAGLGLGEVAELLVEHALELERRDESGGVRGGLLVEKETTTLNLIWSQSFNDCGRKTRQTA